ncbi:unnamed protein product [Victoria cruziana]
MGKIPCCSVCQMNYDDGARVPMLLQCGHGFCRDCLSQMFAATADDSLSCPRCRHRSRVGNSVDALCKNFAFLSLVHQSEFDCSDDDEEEEEEEEEGRLSRGFRGSRNVCGRGGHATSSSGSIDLGSHSLKMVRQIAEGRRAGMDLWAGVLTGPGECRHRVAVKRVRIMPETDIVWVQSRLEVLRRASMWCRNVCTFHGALRIEDRLCLVMDRYEGSVQSAMQNNEGRLTLEQILRYGADIARGVAELHAAGIVCMNLKPSNLLLDANGRAVVSDYGLLEILKRPDCRKAHSVPEVDSTRMHSCMDCTMLCPNYTAPEAWEPGKKSLNIFWDDALGMSAESDAWSFGCTLVEMCTGSAP